MKYISIYLSLEKFLFLKTIMVKIVCKRGNLNLIESLVWTILDTSNKEKCLEGALVNVQGGYRVVRPEIPPHLKRPLSLCINPICFQIKKTSQRLIGSQGTAFLNCDLGDVLIEPVSVAELQLIYDKKKFLLRSQMSCWLVGSLWFIISISELRR